VIESLYYEINDGEIFIIQDENGDKRMVTCIDICSLYKGKKGKAILLVE
jgi:hypothetical protein